MTKLILPEPTQLYRHFDEKGRLLYVGISLNAISRAKQHGKDKPWWLEVRSIQIELFPTREEAAQAEVEAIRKEKPLYNIVHNREGPLKFIWHKWNREKAESYWWRKCEEIQDLLTTAEGFSLKSWIESQWLGDVTTMDSLLTARVLDHQIKHWNEKGDCDFVFGIFDPFWDPAEVFTTEHARWLRRFGAPGGKDRNGDYNFHTWLWFVSACSAYEFLAQDGYPGFLQWDPELRQNLPEGDADEALISM